MRAAAVVPNHHPHLDFLHAWGELAETPIIVVQDLGAKPASVPGGDITVYDHADIEADLGENAWIIPTGTSACRSYGFYKAWQAGAEVILTLDTDCFPERADGYWLREHLGNLDARTPLGWWSTVPLGYMRGFPYRVRRSAPVWLSHGLWSGVPDLDAPTQLLHPDLRFAPAANVVAVPRWNHFPMCGMNLAFRAELAPAMYFGLFGPAWGMDHFDDIWAGLLAKRILDHLGLAAVSGAPSVEHRRQSDVFANLRKQAPGLELNEHLWRAVEQVRLEGSSVLGCYRELVRAIPESLPGGPEGWLSTWKRAALIWSDLFA